MIPGYLSYAPAADGWIVVAHERIVSLLDPSVTRDTIDRLWLAITAPDVTVESYVAAIPLFGEDAVAGFAVVVVDDFGLESGTAAAGLTVVLRGAARVSLVSATGTRVVDARDANPWYLAQFGAVVAFTVAGAALGDDDVTRLLPLAGAVGVASVVEWAAVRRAASAPAGIEDTVLRVGTGRRQPAQVVRDGEPVHRDVHGTPIAARTTGAEENDDAVAVDGVTILRPPVVDAADDARTGQTEHSPRRTPSSAANVPAGVADDNTPSADAPAAAPATMSFRIGTGSPVSLTSVAYVGRKPSPPRVSHGPVPQLVRVDSPRQEVSSTHVEIRQVGSTVVVTDLRSTNGTAVSVPGARRLVLRQGESLVVVPGTLIDLGDGNVVEILPAG